MNIQRIVIEVKGQYDLPKLEKFQFRKVNYKNIRTLYRFDGVMHRYSFIPIDDRHFKIVITPRPGRDLFHEISFRKIGDGEIIRWLDTIKILSGKRN